MRNETQDLDMNKNVGNDVDGLKKTIIRERKRI